MKKITLLFILLLSHISGFANEAENLIKQYLEESETVGIAVAIVDDDKVQFYNFGKMSLLSEDPVTLDTLFEIGSITKVFTTLTLVDLVNKGEIQLDEPIQTYLPNVKVPKFNGKEITIRHLATHTSGLPSVPSDFNPKNPDNPYLDYTQKDLYELLNGFTLQRAPGSEFEYSNIGMGLLGHILSLKSGLSYEELITQTISKKLNMESTVITLTPEMEKRFATGHAKGQVVEHWDIPFLAGAGAFRSNIKDMTLFLKANMEKNQIDPSGLSYQEQFAVPSLEARVGLGWVLSCQNGHEIIWHNGGTGGFRSFLGFNKKLKRGVVILANSAKESVDPLGFRLLEINTSKKKGAHDSK